MKSTENFKLYFDYYIENCYSMEKLKNNPFAVSLNLLRIRAKKYLNTLWPLEDFRFIKIEKPNFLLKEIDGEKDLYALYRNQEEKEYVSKHCYETVIHVNSESVRSFAERLGCHPNKIKTLSSYYATHVLGLTKSEYAKQIEEARSKLHREISDHYWQNFENNTKDILNHLEELTIDDDVIHYLNSLDVNMNFLYERVTNHVILYHPERKDFLIQNLHSKIDLYRNWKREQNKQKMKEKMKLLQEEKLNKAILCIHKFLNYKTLITKEKFCKQEGITLKDFDKYLESIYEENYELYEKCKKRLEDNSARFFLIQKAKIEKIIEYLTYGILEDDGVRDFNLLDFYLTCHLDFKEANKVAKCVLNPDEYKKFVIFIHQNEKSTGITYKQIMEEKKYIHIQKDEDGRFIEGSGVLMTDEEKQEIIDFLNFHHIPINTKTYKQACSRYLQNGLKKENLILAKKKSV